MSAIIESCTHHPGPSFWRFGYCMYKIKAEICSSYSRVLFLPVKDTFFRTGPFLLSFANTFHKFCHGAYWKNVFYSLRFEFFWEHRVHSFHVISDFCFRMFVSSCNNILKLIALISVNFIYINQRNFSALYRISKWSIFISISKLLENLVRKS